MSRVEAELINMIFSWYPLVCKNTGETPLTYAGRLIQAYSDYHNVYITARERAVIALVSKGMISHSPIMVDGGGNTSDVLKRDSNPLPPFIMNIGGRV